MIMSGEVSGKKLKVFALVLTRHRLWGALLLPYLILMEAGKSYYRLSECLFPYPQEEGTSSLDLEERDIVNIINEYNERNLFSLYSRDKSVKEFLSNITPDRIERFIRPYIERRLIKCFKIAREENIPVYYQKTKSVMLHPEDLLDLGSENAEPVFRFSRTEEQTTYSLSLEITGKQIDLTKSAIDILCTSPCVIREDNRILFVSNIDGSKLRPFISKEYILIPKKTELKYFSSFVLNTINNFKVEGKGFEIIEFIPDREACLQLDMDLKGLPVLILTYNYPGNKIFASEPRQTFTIFDNNDGQFVFRKYNRQLQWEKDCRVRLEELSFYSEDDISFFSSSSDGKNGNALYSLIEAVNFNYQELTEAGFVLSTRLRINYNFKPVSIELSSTLINDWFDLKAVVKIGEWEIPFTRFRKNIVSGIREFELPDGTVAVLPEAWFPRYKNIFEFGKSDEDIIKLHKQHFSLLSDTPGNEGKPAFERLGRLLIPEHLPELDPPKGLNCTMRNYQAEGLNWLNFLQTAGLGGCLADDMGLGKTIQTLALLQYNKENITSGRSGDENTELTLFSRSESRLTSLIVVPASLIYNWEKEIKKFVPGMAAYSHKGNQRKKSASWFGNFDIVISSYHTVRQDIDLLATFQFHYIILDESQTIKNPGSAVYRTITRLKSSFKLVLTGTPVENSLTDLWSQLNFVNPGLLGDLSFFRREFANPIEKEGDDSQEDKLRNIIKPFILRRTKEMVAGDLPPVTEQTVYCDMTEEQHKLYEEEKSAVRNSIFKSIETTGVEKSAIVVLQGLMKLRQISNHPLMAYEDYNSGSGKFETVMQDMESVISEGHKILVFSSFVKHLTLYATELAKKRIRFSLLTGATTDREKTVNAFQDNPDIRIFLISLKAGGVGLNLTSADYVFILDPWWNPASEVQAMNRAHRIGQDKNVFVYRYITTNTIEEKITRLQEKKSKLADTFIASNNPLKDIDVKKILDIIG
jgi:superfamily II DNA or RNA helicase